MISGSRECGHVARLAGQRGGRRVLCGAAGDHQLSVLKCVTCTWKCMHGGVLKAAVQTE